MNRNKILQLVVLIILCLNASLLNAASITWNSAVTGNWSLGTNWVGGVAPGASDIAVFNSTNVGNCTIDLATVTIAGIQVNTGYTGIITQSSANTSLTIGSSNAAFGAGTFIGNTGSSTSIIINGTFTLTGTNFTSTTGTLTFNNSVTNTSGTFTHNNGTVVFNSSSAQTIPLWSFYNLTSSNTGGRTLASGVVYIFNVFTPSTNVYTSSGNTINYNGSGAQIITAFDYYNNLTLSSTGTRSVTGVVKIKGKFDKGTNTISSITGSTIEYNGTGGQTIIAFNYYNLTISGTGKTNNDTLSPTGTVNIANTFTNSSSFISGKSIVGSTSIVNYSGTGTQTIIPLNYYRLTISGARTTNNVTFDNTGTIGIANIFSNSATFTTGGFITNGSTIDYNGTSTQTILALNYYNLTSSSTGVRTLASSGIIGIANVFNKGTNAYASTGSVVNYNGTGAQTVMALNYNHLIISGAHTTNSVTLDNTGTIGIAKEFNNFATFTTGSLVSIGSTIEYNGTLPEAIAPIQYNNVSSTSTGERSFATSGTVKISGNLNKGSNTFVNGGFNGESFTPLNSQTSANIASCTSVSSSIAYIAGDVGTILKTIDGGTTWSKQTTPTTNNLRDIEFYDSNNGLAIGSTGVLLRTTDGGSSWNTVTTPAPTQTFSGIYYMTSLKVLISVGNGTLLKSIDGGATWTTKTCGTNTQGLYGMYFIHPDTGFVVGNAGVIYKTNDAGETWSDAFTGTGAPSTYLYGSVYFTDRNTGYLTGYNSGGATGIILKTTNGGGTWSTLITSSNHMGTVQFVNSTTGYICGGNVANNTGIIWMTRDAGANWTMYNLGSYRVAGMELTSSAVGYISGLNGAIQKFSCCSNGGTVEFNGAVTQRVLGSSTNVKLNKIKINKSSGKLLLNIPVEVDKQLLLTKGVIGSSSTNYLQFNNNSTSQSGNDSAFVSGPIKKIGNQLFTFPLGDTLLSTGAYHPLAITAPSSATDSYSAQYFATNQSFGSTLQIDSLESISNCEYWDLNRLSGSSTVIPSISWNSSSCNVNSFDDLAIVYWDNNSAPTPQWKSMGVNSIIINNNTGVITALTGIYDALYPTLHLTIGKYKTPVCAMLRRELDGGCHTINNGALRFKYDEEYADSDGKLKFNIYNALHQIVASNSLMSSSVIQPTVHYGDNRYTFNILNCGFSSNGSIGNGIYILEVINEKNEKWYLRFKNVVTQSVTCPGDLGH